MTVNRYPHKISLGLLPEPEGRLKSFVTSSTINLILLALAIFVGVAAKHVVVQHQYEQTVLIMPNTPPPEKVKLPEPPKLKAPPPKLPEFKMEAARINMPKPEPKPDLKPIQMEAKVTVPVMRAAKQAVILAPQPKQALAAAAAPALTPQAKPSTTPVHFGSLQGVIPNPNATRPATIAAIGNPYGGMSGPAVAPRGIVGSTGFGNGTKSGSSAGVVGKVASAGIPGATNVAMTPPQGKVVAAGIPAMQTAVAAPRMIASPVFTSLEVLSKPPVQYTSEAKQFKVQGDVILRVTFTAAGQVVVQNVVHGLGHGLDEEARRVAQQIRFHPATRNGQAVDMTTNITITFQLA
jgi:TonB family protein